MRYRIHGSPRVGGFVRWYFICQIAVVFFGCSVNGSFQGLYGYYHKTLNSTPGLIQKPRIPVCNLLQPDTPIVYAINGLELKACTGEFEKMLVYIWRPKCSSAHCISPKNIQLFCDTHKIELFLVAEYYNPESMTLNHAVERPVFGVDCTYYGTNLTQKYMSGFLSDLLGEAHTPYEKQFFLFENGCLINATDTLEEIL